MGLYGFLRDYGNNEKSIYPIHGVPARQEKLHNIQKAFIVVLVVGTRNQQWKKILENEIGMIDKVQEHLQ